MPPEDWETFVDVNPAGRVLAEIMVDLNQNPLEIAKDLNEVPFVVAQVGREPLGAA